ncbi:MAG: metallophosphoesterase [Candidatus Eisenbacteria bacterium]|nr:metallophosphoesterase [Candidatus Eisenbacteria bacterium]
MRLASTRIARALFVLAGVVGLAGPPSASGEARGSSVAAAAAAPPAPASPQAGAAPCAFPDALHELGALHGIYRPLSTMPSLLRSGDTLTVWMRAPGAAAAWRAGLRYGTLAVPLVPLAAAPPGTPSPGFRHVRFRVPPGTPEELYDLVVVSDSTGPDTSRHSVKVLREFRREYYFAQVSDTHFPTRRLSVSPLWGPCDTSGLPDINAVIEDLNLIHPEFVLHTGDLVNEGYLQETYRAYTFARVKQHLLRFRDPLFLVPGNHDIGGSPILQAPAGTARKEWWRAFGWEGFLDSPPPDYACHSQMYSFDYGPLHLTGMETYINYDSYDSGRYGAYSFTQEQLNWLARDLAAAGGRHKLLFYHYDFKHQLDVRTLGVDGAVFGHEHSQRERSRDIPFDLETGEVCDGARTYRIFRVRDGVVTPTLMQHADGSLRQDWDGPNDGTRARAAVLVTNSSAETWEHAQVVFHMQDRDSAYAAGCGTVAQVVREGGMAHVYVDCVLPGGGASTVISVFPASAGAPGPCGAPFRAPHLLRPSPNPWRVAGGPLALRYALSAPGEARIEVFDVAGRRVATLADARSSAGPHSITWDGRTASAKPLAAGLYIVRLASGGVVRAARFVALP